MMACVLVAGRQASRLQRWRVSGRPMSLVESMKPSPFRDSPALCPQTGMKHLPQGSLWLRASLASREGGLLYTMWLGVQQRWLWLPDPIPGLVLVREGGLG